MINNNLDKYIFDIDVIQEDIDTCDPESPLFCAIGNSLIRNIGGKCNVNGLHIIIDNDVYDCDHLLSLWQFELIKKRYKVKPIRITFYKQTLKAKIESYKPVTCIGWIFKTLRLRLARL